MAASTFPRTFRSTTNITFTTTGEIGKGTFSTVYGVTGPGGSEYALKVYEVFRNKQKEIIDMLPSAKKEREQLYKAAGVPHTLTCFGILHLDLNGYQPQVFHQALFTRRFALLMERGQGINLEKCGQLRIDEIESIAKQGLETLVALRNRNSVHRDIKPGNFLFDRRTGDLALVDFGFAEDADKIDPEKFKGSLCCAAPEAVLCTSLSPASDMWSFGASLFELLTMQLLIEITLGSCKLQNRVDCLHLMEQQMGGLPPRDTIPIQLLKEEGYFEEGEGGEVKIKKPATAEASDEINGFNDFFGASSGPIWEKRLRYALQLRGASSTQKRFFLELIGSMLRYNKEDRIQPADALRRFFTIVEEKTG